MARMMGIDLGHSAVNAVLYEGSFGRFQYKGAYRVPVPQDGGVPDLSVRIAAANAIIDEACPDGVRPQVVLAWPTLDASVRLVKLPFGDRAQVERTLPFEVEGQVPFDLDDVLLTHRIVSLSAGDSRVLVSLINREQYVLYVKSGKRGTTQSGRVRSPVVTDVRQPMQAKRKALSAPLKAALIAALGRTFNG